MIFLRQCFGTFMVWLSLGLSLFLSHIVTVSDLLAAVIVNVDVYASAKKHIPVWNLGPCQNQQR